MELHISDRNTGKTFMLMEWLNMSENHYVIVHSTSEQFRLQKDYPLLKDRILPVYSVMSGALRGRRNVKVAVDNLDLVLPQLLGTFEIGPVTYSGDHSYGTAMPQV